MSVVASVPTCPTGGKTAPAEPAQNDHVTHLGKIGGAALLYVRDGLPVFPCRAGGKEPATPNGLLDAKCSESAVRDCWTKHPTLNVAITTGAVSGLFVLDVDGRVGADSLRMLELEHGPLPLTKKIITPSGGAHYVFRHPGLELRNTVSALAPGLDTRGDGGYVLAAPSVVDGRPYVVAEDVDPAPIPPWLLDLLIALRDGPRRQSTTPILAPGNQDQDEDQDPHREEERSSARAGQMAELLAVHAAGRLEPEPVDGVGSLPDRPTRAERALHELLVLRFGLRLADGTCDPLPLATSVVVDAGIVATKGGASKLLHRFEGLGIIWSPGELPSLGKGNGTRTFLPGPKPDGPEPRGGWCVRPAVESDCSPGAELEAGAVAVETQDRPQIAVDPQVEAVDQPSVRDAVGRGPAGALDGVVAASGSTVVRSAHGREAYEPSMTSRPSIAVLLGRAVRRGGPGSRNDAGFWLACQMRDNDHDELEAERAVLELRDLMDSGDHPYSTAEALRSVGSAYSTPPRPPWGAASRPAVDTLDAELEAAGLSW